VSADILKDDVTDFAFYKVDIALSKGVESTLEEGLLVPGMPVEAHVRTSERSRLSYLTKPLTDYFTRSFRES
jgi:HlyD family secretion protein